MPRKEPKPKIATIFGEMKFSDVQIQCGNTVFNAHRILLSIWWPVFRLMFEADTFEKESGKVTIDNIRPEVFVEMLHFFYTGQLNCDITEENAIELLKEADKYLIDHLKTLCKEKLRQELWERRERDCPRRGAL